MATDDNARIYPAGGDGPGSYLPVIVFSRKHRTWALWLGLRVMWLGCVLARLAYLSVSIDGSKAERFRFVEHITIGPDPRLGYAMQTEHGKATVEQ